MNAWRLILTISGVCGVAGCGKPQEDTARAEVPPTVVLWQTPTSERFVESRRFVGKVSAVRTVEVAFEVGGRLLDLPHNEGAFVQGGEILAVLDLTPFALALEAAELAHEVAAVDLDRQQRLLKTRATAVVDFERAENAFRAGELDVRVARRNLALTQVSVPFDARVSRRLVEPGAQVGPGEPVLRVQDVSECRVRFSLPEELLAPVLTPGAVEVEVEFGVAPGQRFSLAYREHATEPDAISLTYTMTFGLKMPEGLQVLPGMSATVIIRPTATGVARATSVRVPLGAVEAMPNGGARVWVFREDEGTVSARSVKTGAVAGDLVEIFADFLPADRVVASGFERLRDGMVVRPFYTH